MRNSAQYFSRSLCCNRAWCKIEWNEKAQNSFFPYHIACRLIVSFCKALSMFSDFSRLINTERVCWSSDAFNFHLKNVLRSATRNKHKLHKIFIDNWEITHSENWINKTKKKAKRQLNWGPKPDSEIEFVHFMAFSALFSLAQSSKQIIVNIIEHEKVQRLAGSGIYWFIHLSWKCFNYSRLELGVSFIVGWMKRRFKLVDCSWSCWMIQM